MKPSATYRLQLNKEFPLSKAMALVDHLDELGIDTVYLSPIMQAVPGSMHGYDVTDPTMLNPEIGTDEEFEAFALKLKEKGMGLLVDFVPNHMCIDSRYNPWWCDVLKHGKDSRYASYFDIDWAAASGKVVLPILGAPLDQVIADGELRTEGTSSLIYHSHMLPLNPESHINDDLHELLTQQHYLLCDWREGKERLNYRRFFDIDSLAGLRVEREEVFDAVHSKLFQLIDQGWVTGVRLDHVDGLFDPAAYFTKLRERLGSTYVIVEKILSSNERLREGWEVDGTTGYEFLNLLNGVFVDQKHRKQFAQIYHDFTGTASSAKDVIYESKLAVLQRSMPSELRSLARMLGESSEALAAIIASFPVYRTYITETITPQDADDIAIATQEAKKRNPQIDPAFFDRIDKVLRTENEEATPFVRRFQQLTGPVMAKGVEDTSFYRYFPLASLNEVGGELGRFGTSVEEFHAKNLERQEKWPHTLLATSTHDTKRSEDVRARLNVLSEIPEIWNETLNLWATLVPSHIDPNTEYLFYQTIVGAWPLEGIPPSFVDRIEHYMIKAVKEAKQQTCWAEPNAEYEESVRQFVQEALASPLVEAVDLFVKQNVLQPGMYNSLCQTVLKCTVPGVPDFYQGTEMWDLRLVDPDNRRPVDYTQSVQSLIKTKITKQTLAFRHTHPDLFHDGSYTPLYAEGEQAHRVIAFARQHGDKTLIVVTGRFFAGAPEWDDTKLLASSSLSGLYIDEYTGNRVTLTPNGIPLSTLLQTHPIALLKKVDE